MSKRTDDLDESDALLLAAWAEANLTPVTPPAELRARILGGLGGIERFRSVTEALRRFVDLGADAVAELLRKVDEPAAWSTGLPGLPGIRYFHFSPGAAANGAEAGFVRLEPGATFPHHRHLGPERTFVVEGVMHDGGRVYGPGSVLDSAAGTAHHYTAGPGRDLVIISLHNGIELA
ncbi:MAG TPA: cupin domain-containing protein [Polyangia bacterium]|nr:cupin domain-containing protein [Polyangia bacterium]